MSDIIVGWDGSEAARKAVAWATEQARSTAGRVVLVHVIPPPTPSGDFAARPIGADEREALAREMRAAAPGAEIELVEAPSPGAQIVDAAIRRGASLVCVGTRGRGGFTRLLLGSVADHVVRHSPVPVVTLRS